MTTPSGTIGLSDVNIELGYSSTAFITMNDAAVRTLAGVPSGTISMQNLQNKTNAFTFTISSNTTNLDVRAAGVSAGWNQTSRLICNIDSGVYVYSTSTGSYATTVSGSFPNGVVLNNSGTILGRGGNGGNGVTTAGQNGGAGGPALYVTSAVSINNIGRISGGGGGGGSGGGNNGCGCCPAASGGGGGGIGNGNGGNGYTTSCCTAVCSGLAGSAGTLTSNGGAGRSGVNGNLFSGSSGSGGSYGASGGGGTTGYGFDDCGGCGYIGSSGGPGGAAVVGNSNITWINTGTRNGSIS